MQPETILNVVIGGIIGAVTSLVTGYIFYKRGGNELHAEAGRLRAETVRVRQAVDVLGRAMEAAEWATIVRDADGNMTGLVFTAEAAPSIHIGRVQGEGTAGPSPGPAPGGDAG